MWTYLNLTPEAKTNWFNRHQPKHGKPSGVSKLQKRAARLDAKINRFEDRILALRTKAAP